MIRYPRYTASKLLIEKLILKNEFECGNVSADETFEIIVMRKRAEILEMHKQHRSIWQNKSKRWCTKLGDEKRLIVRKEKEDLENAIVEYYLTREQRSVSVAEVFNQWQKYEEANQHHSQKTINEYGNEFIRFFQNDAFSACPIQEITEKDVTLFLKRVVYGSEKIPQKRYKAVKTVLMTIFNHAKMVLEIDCIPIRNILDDLRFPTYAFRENVNDKKQVFLHSEIKMIKDSLDGSDNLLELGILLCIETGLRVGELCALRRECVLEDRLLIQNSEHRARFDGKVKYWIGNPKCNKVRAVILSDDAKMIVTRILSLHDSQWLFPRRDDAEQWMKAFNFDKEIRRVCNRLGIEPRSMHKLRKTYASCLLAQKDLKISEKMVQEQLGHADISTTLKAYYYNVFDDDEKVSILRRVKVVNPS